jgi:hypothetical protein
MSPPDSNAGVQLGRMQVEKVFVANASREFIAETCLRLFRRVRASFFISASAARRCLTAAPAEWIVARSRRLSDRGGAWPRTQ